jgi:5'-deoxynucleotidase YfbR-like HD superfamily hydrolase
MSQDRENRWPPVAVREKLAAQLRAFTRAGDVARFHTRPQLQPQNVGAHCYGVAWLCWLLRGGRPTAELLYAALIHDTPEFVTGDTPGPIKHQMGNGLVEMERAVYRKAQLREPELDDEERRVLHLADSLDGLRHCVRERQLGNQLLKTCYERYRSKSEQLARLAHERYVLDFIVNQWEKAKCN